MARAWYTTDYARKTARRIGTFFGVLLGCWLLSFIPSVSRVFQAIEGAVYQGSAAIGRATGRFLASEDSLSTQLGVCTNRLESAVTTAANVEAHAREGDEWKALVSYTQRTQQKGTPARVIARDTPEVSLVTIDRGESDGVKAGSAVVIGDGILFGVVNEVSATSATVRLTEDTKSAIPGAILGTAKTIGLVTGAGGAVLSMNYIPQDTKITVNDIVVTSGLGGRIGQGIVIGTVTNIVATPSSPFVQASITPVHDAREWTAVLVLPYPEATL